MSTRNNYTNAAWEEISAITSAGAIIHTKDSFLTQERVAKLVGVSRATVNRHYQMARVRMLTGAGAAGPDALEAAREVAKRNDPEEIEAAVRAILVRGRR